MDHCRDVELDQRLEERIPRFVNKWRSGPSTTGRIRVQVTADKLKFIDAARKFINAVFDGYANGLRQLADANEIIGKQLRDAMNRVVIYAGPCF